MRRVLDSPEQTMALGERIGRTVVAGTVIALRGGLAAGKTTFTKGLARGLAVDEDVTSPTYTLISEYSGRLPLYHMDAYRLSGTEDFLAIGAEEYLYGDGVCVVEWSERVSDCLPPETVVIEIAVLEGGRRLISIEGLAAEEALA
jgi:tRNA threonylcarbamoyladenosine biosynthesis protein TsaE